MNDSTDIFKTVENARVRAENGRFKVGDLIMNRYKILAELGQGGMGVVYKCFDKTAGVEIALKALPPELAHNTFEMEDIKENFQLVSQLVHQNIAISKNLEYDAPYGSYYLIMECVKGEDLRRWIRRKRREADLTINDVLPIIKQVAEALDYAHKHKIIHRDIKPANIMINEDGEVKILDFGLAAQIHSSMTRLSVGYRGTSGTGPYMSPEQWSGKVQKAPADQYALAVMAYEMLAGNLPFEGTDLGIMQQAVLTQEADEIPGLPAAAQQALKRAMRKNPAERFATCSEFADALSGKGPVFTAQLAPQQPQMSQETTAPRQEEKKKGFWHNRFKGRASRMQFWRYQVNWLMAFILIFTIAWFSYWDVRYKLDLALIWSIIIFLIITIPWNLGIVVKRLHDTGESGYYMLLLLFPVIGWIWLLILLLRKSQDDKNEYGEPPQKLTKKALILPGSLAIVMLLPWTRLVILVILAYCGLISELHIPYGITKIESEAFRHCSSLTNITIPSSVKEIGAWAFQGCKSLTNITIQNGVTEIGFDAFRDCSSLKNITIPSSVKKIGYDAFMDAGCEEYVKKNYGHLMK